MEIVPNQTSNTTHSVKVGRIEIGGPQFTVIAGPCSIDTEDLFRQTTQHVKAAGASMIRGGIWKMRTSAQDFQGLGTDAFASVRRVLKENQIDLVSEVTDPRQIEMLDDVVVMYQVGSRNMHNTALLKELGRTRKPVLLKRGFAALVDEWIKAAEYITSGGNKDVILCERGIRTFETATRNTLDLNAVVYVKARTSLPVIVDPSHAIGIRSMVPQLCLAAAASGADGIIVEVHPSPETALSDGKQTLNLPEFSQMMKQLERVLTALDRPLQRI